jgi:hypothetical protein
VIYTKLFNENKIADVKRNNKMDNVLLPVFISVCFVLRAIIIAPRVCPANDVAL